MATDLGSSGYALGFGVAQAGSLSVGTQRASTEQRYVTLEMHSLNLQPTRDGSEVSANKSFTIPPGETPTTLSIISTVSSAAIKHIRSAAAVGIQRRRQVSQIAKHLRRLPGHAEQQDFHSVAFPVFDMVRRTYQDLAQFDQYEGNTCMILRYLRNSLVDGGWNRYKEKTVATAVADLLDRISKSESVNRQDAMDTFRLFYELKLRATLPVVIESGDAEHEE